MGHMYPEEISKLMQSTLAENDTTTASAIIEKAIAQEIGVSCAEGTYHERYMYEMAVWSLLDVYQDNGCIQFATRTLRQKQALQWWLSNELVDAWEYDDGGAKYWSLRMMEHLPFALRLADKLPIVSYIEH